MNEVERLDSKDLEILRILQQNARLTTKELASQVNLSTTPVFERLKRLENNGIIEKYVAVLNDEKLNHGFVVFCNVKLIKMNTDVAKKFTARIDEIPEVTECYNISGSFDYLLKINARNMKHYQQFLINDLGQIESIGSIESTFVMERVKHLYGISF
ncbi:MAG: Lrp/AsnC family transcriptional regulator [Rikenellaceae bacterium]